jgi:hypothetical protein
MTPDDMIGTDTDAGDGQWSLSDSEATQIVPLEYYENRQGDLAGTATVSRVLHTYLNLLTPTPPPAIA